MSIEHVKFVVERSYPAARERVFAAWADPGLKARWFSTPVASADEGARLKLTEQVAALDGLDTAVARERGTRRLLERLAELLVTRR